MPPKANPLTDNEKFLLCCLEYLSHESLDCSKVLEVMNTISHTNVQKRQMSRRLARLQAQFRVEMADLVQLHSESETQAGSQRNAVDEDSLSDTKKDDEGDGKHSGAVAGDLAFVVEEPEAPNQGKKRKRGPKRGVPRHE